MNPGYFPLYISFNFDLKFYIKIWYLSKLSGLIHDLMCELHRQRKACVFVVHGISAKPALWWCLFHLTVVINLFVLFTDVFHQNKKVFLPEPHWKVLIVNSQFTIICSLLFLFVFGSFAAKVKSICLLMISNTAELIFGLFACSIFRIWSVSSSALM